ncbi:hypothetical protein ACJMK2_007428 [Sinanodonta woodiana]|uniref:Peptidase M12B domain-containing protein n=1 Tax=Sinanodonta woodiana TaxID=1069815 RepID=A0ABD3VK29_SINWO
MGFMFAASICSSLGAVHDGEGEAISCQAEDGYIMTPGIPVFDSNKLYSKNPWLFSTCSVEAFKKTLANKDCVTRKPVYNEAEIDEWNKFMNKLPGQKYTYSEQCELTFGRGYAYCGVWTMY